MRVSLMKTMKQTTSLKNLSKNQKDFVSKKYEELSKSRFALARINF